MNDSHEYIFFVFTGVFLCFFAIYICLYGYKTNRGIEKSPPWDCGVVRVGEIKVILIGIVIFAFIFFLVKMRWCVTMLIYRRIYSDILLWEIIDGGYLMICRFFIIFAERHVKCLKKNDSLRKCQQQGK